MGMTKAAWMRTAPMSEISEMKKNTAPTLQRVPGMKSIFVGLLAVFALTGCGVGMDELEGEQDATKRTAHELMGESADKPMSVQGEIRGPLVRDALNGLPQDPVPDLEGKPSGPAGPRTVK